MPNTKLLKKCPCCSGKIFSACCHPFLNGESLPTVAVQLMRSRYSAYSLTHIEYIQQTMCGKAAEGYDAKEAKQWAQQAIWCGLNVINSGKQNAESDKDEVEFIARYILENELHIIHEKSQFQKIAGKWFYISGELIPHKPIALAANSQCPCGSRKKYAQCCGEKHKNVGA